jgi:5,10-methylene-tetrahydrofolate dehydrogenase/methenyl tetrahydrofolate cyclohydrolase
MQGCIELLDRSGVKISGAHAAVIGRSNIVGMPVALLLLGRDATVTIVHSRTPNAADVVRQADIVIAAAGKAEMVRGDWIKPGAAVIDVGTNPVDVRPPLWGTARPCLYLSLCPFPLCLSIYLSLSVTLPLSLTHTHTHLCSLRL